MMDYSVTRNRILGPWERMANENEGAAFVDSLLRGVGQVMFQNNPITGLFFLVGIFFNSAWLGLAGLIGLLSSTLAAMILKADRGMVRAGLFGFNGVLTGIGLAFFLRISGWLILYIVIAGVVSTIIMMAIANLGSRRGMPALTAPFVITAWLFMAGAFLFAFVRPNELLLPIIPNPSAAIQTVLRPLPLGALGSGITFANLLQAFFRGVGEVFFQDNLVTGIIFLLAILVNSPISAGFAALGSLVGMITAFILGGNGYWIFHGLYGFNAVLSAIAIGGIFYVLNVPTTIYAILCAIVATILTASLSVFLSPIGIPVLTAPFVLTTWFFLLPKEGFGVLKPVALADVGTPEQVKRTAQEREQALGGRVVPQNP